MPLDLDDIHISSTLGEELALSPYFPTVFSTGSKQTELSDIVTEVVTSPIIVTYLDTPIDSILYILIRFKNNDTYTDYTVNLDLDTNELVLLSDTTFKTELKDSLIDTQSKFKTETKLGWLINTQVSYYNDVTFHNKINILNHEVKLYDGTVPFINVLDNILYLSNSKMFETEFSVYSTKEKIFGDLLYDIEVGHGRIIYILGDVYCAIENNLSISGNVYCTKQNILSIINDIKDTTGNIINIQSDVYSSILTMSSITHDIRLNSLHIINFSLHFEDYSYLGDYLYVDILDFLFDIDTTGSYFELDGEILLTSFINITNGVRAKCVIDDKFISNKEILIKVIASNSIGDLFYENYYLLFGYSVELNNSILFDYNKEVLVHSCASNLVECPNNECNSFVFTTIDYPSYNLNASISCVVSEDLSAEIYPQSTAFFYGRSYRVIVSNIKDNSGNYLAPVVMEFTIEDE